MWVCLYLSQIIGGAVLHDGSIAEMKTGEGKTLVSTLAAYLNALTGEGVHGRTSNCPFARDIIMACSELIEVIL